MSKNEGLNTNNDKKQDFSEELAKIDSLKRKVLFSCLKGGGEYNSKITGFSHMLKQKYPDHQKYIFYHKLIGSSPPSDSTKLDFPDSDSIYGFLQGLFLELEKTKLEKNIKDDDIEKDRKETVELLRGSYPNYFNEENLIREGDKWCVIRFGKCLPIPEWIKETEDDISYHSADDKKDRYR